ncbi:hypothetical protein ACFL32_00945 [Candidatus Neomarinimicrobiota bacterium]
MLIPWLSPLSSQEDTTLVYLEQLGGRRAPAALANMITVQVEQINFEEALLLIAREGKLGLSYNHSQLPLQQSVSLELADVPVLEALYSLLEQTGAELVITEKGQIAIVPGEQRKKNNRD